MTSPRAFRKRLEGAFTLVETVLAIGIVSTVLIALMGLMPEGMNIVREAGSRTVGAQVAQKLIGEVQLAEFDEIDQLASRGVRYFDDMGTELKADGVTRFYSAKIEVSAETPALPGMRASEHLKSVIVKVSANPVVPDFSDEGAGRDYLRYSTLIVDVEDEM